MIAWFEIPVTNMKRAKQFYETVLDITIEEVNFGGFEMGWFPRDNNGPSGSLVKQESYVPSKEGILIYFTCKNVQNKLDKVETAGGKIYQPKTQISEEHGFMGVFIDTEGNRIALHSQQSGQTHHNLSIFNRY